MKIILPIFLLLSFLPVQAEASEIFGLISTNPAAPTVTRRPRTASKLANQSRPSRAGKIKPAPLLYGRALI